MPDKEFSKTMRIDLIPDVPARPSGNQRQRVVFERQPGASIPRTPREDGDLEDSHFQRLLQRLYDAALIADVHGRIVDVNVRAEEFLSYSGGELRGMTVSDVISGADESVLRTVSDNLENERHTLIQAYCLRKDGSYFPAEVAVSKLGLGRLHLCFFIRDITIRRQAEEMLITEHNVRETLDLIDRAYILHDGRVLMEGKPSKIVADAEVRRVYLGERFNW